MAIIVTCTCGKQFKVKEELAGKRGKCAACGRVLSVPTLAPSVDQEKASPSPLRACPTCGEALQPNAVICLNCGLDLRTGKQVPQAKSVAPAAPSRASAKAPASSARPWGAEESHATIPCPPDRGPKPVPPLDASRELKVALLADLGFTFYMLAQMAYLYSRIPSSHSFFMSGEVDRYIQAREEMGFAIALSCALVLFNAFAVVRELKRKKHSFRLLFAVLFASVPVQIMRIGGFFSMIDKKLLLVDSGEAAKIGFMVLIGLVALSYDIAWFLMLRRFRATHDRMPPDSNSSV